MPAPMTPEQFVATYAGIDLPERGVSQSHFTDLCRLLGHPTPVEADRSGGDFAFEKHTLPTTAASRGSKEAGGYVDVFKRGHFIWEYKRPGRHASLDAAYLQAVQCRDALDNPPLTVVCDVHRTPRTEASRRPTYRCRAGLNARRVRRGEVAFL